MLAFASGAGLTDGTTHFYRPHGYVSVGHALETTYYPVGRQRRLPRPSTPSSSLSWSLRQLQSLWRYTLCCFRLGPGHVPWSQVSHTYPKQFCQALAFALTAAYHIDPPSQPLRTRPLGSGLGDFDSFGFGGSPGHLLFLASSAFLRQQTEDAYRARQLRENHPLSECSCSNLY